MTTVLVTGAGSGIGAAVCRRMARQGAALVIHTGQHLERAQALALECAGAEHRLVVGDLAEPETVVGLLRAARELGQLRAVVACAGFADKRGTDELDDLGLNRALQTMVVGLAQLMRTSLPLLAEHPTGRFVAVSSFVAHRFGLGGASFAATAAAKAGVEALVKAAAMDYAARGVTVNAVAPGYVRKDYAKLGSLSPQEWAQVAARIPLGRLATPDDVAAPIEFLLSPQSAYITGQVLRVDGGLTL